MAYTDKKGMSAGQFWALILVVLVHVIIAYGFITGLAFSVIEQVKEVTETFDVAPPPPPPPPPPPERKPTDEVKPAQAPVYTPDTNVPTQSDNTAATTSERQPDLPVPQVAPQASPPPPPPPRVPPKRAKPKNSPQSWATTDDYPSSSLRNEEEGTTAFTLNVGADGKVTGCTVTRSSGHSALDTKTCELATRRARFTPATDGDGNPVPGVFSHSIRWQMPEE